MKSPFPGMDPYIEASGLWEGFHSRLVAEIERTLASAVPDRYFVEPVERSYIVLAGIDEKDRHAFVPDVSVLTSDRSGAQRAPAVVEETNSAEEVTARAFIDEHYRENFIDIYEYDDPKPRLVTSVELLSPSNKRRNTEGWDLYLRKRNAMLLGAANFIEIDLLRGGDRPPMHDPYPNSPYYILLCRKWRAPSCRVRAAHFDRPLPELTIPLANGDPDITLPLQPLVDAVYERSRYTQRIDYRKPLSPPLTSEHIAWVQDRLREAAEGPAKPSRRRGGRRK